MVGLVAYALYKESVREAAQRRAPIDTESRNPTPSMVKVLRSAAERRLADAIDAAIDEATPTIQMNAATAGIATLETSLKGHISSRTSWITAVLTNLGAWLISIVIVAVVVYLIGGPSLESSLADAARRAQAEQQREALPPSGGQRQQTLPSRNERAPK